MSKGSSTKMKGQGLFKLLIFISLMAPLLFVAAVFGTRFGLWDLAFGFEILTLKIAPVLAAVGLVAALLALGLGLRQIKTVWPYVATTMIVAITSLALFQVLGARYAVSGGADVTTNVSEPPPFTRLIAAERRGVITVPETCEGLTSVPRQVAPETASAAMRQAGFIPVGTAAFRADGYRESFWFGQVHHVAIRIRPGQTDVRVAARYPVKAGDQSCQLAKAVVAALQA